MIVGIGIDVVSINRIEKIYNQYGSRFLEKILHPHEMKSIPHIKNQKMKRLASFFAAKEAVSKALGTGFREGLWFTDIEVLRHKSGMPHFSFHGKAKIKSKRLGVKKTWLTLSYEKDLCTVVAILEK